MKMALKSFDYISCREKSGTEILSKFFNLNSDFMLDPVFLVNPAAFDKIIEKSNVNDELIVSYVLDDNEQYNKAYDYLQNKFNTNVLKINPEKADVPVEDWLAYIKKCKFFITDSFHGVCFALLFNKNFICLKNNSRGAARFDTLIETFNISKFFIASINEIYDISITDDKDYSEFNFILQQRQKKCHNILKEVLLNNNSNNHKSKCNKILNHLYLKFCDKRQIKCFLCKVKMIFLPKKRNHYLTKIQNLMEEITWR